MPRARDIGIVIGTLPTGPTNSVLDVAGVGLGHATLHRDEPAPPEGRGTARTGVTCLLLAHDAYPRPRGGGRRGAQRRGRVHRVPQRGRVGADRDAGVADLDDAARPRVRRRVRDRARAASGGGRGGRHPGGGRVRRLLPQRLPADAGERGGRAGGVRRGARLARPGRAAGRRSRRVGDGHVLPGVQGRDRHGLAGDPERARGGGAADDQLRPARPADRRRRTRRPSRRARSRARRPRRPDPASGSWSPTLRWARPTAPGSRAGSGSAWPAPVRRPTTAAARSSWPRARPRGPIATEPGGRATAWPVGRWTRSSRRWSTPPRRPCSTPSSARRRRSAAAATPARGSTPSVVARLLEEHRAGH